MAAVWSLREQVQSVQDLVAMAGGALLQAKAAGQDRVYPETWTPYFPDKDTEARRVMPELVLQAAP